MLIYSSFTFLSSCMESGPFTTARSDRRREVRDTTRVSNRGVSGFECRCCNLSAVGLHIDGLQLSGGHEMHRLEASCTTLCLPAARSLVRISELVAKFTLSKFSWLC